MWGKSKSLILTHTLTNTFIHSTNPMKVIQSFSTEIITITAVYVLGRNKENKMKKLHTPN